MKLSKIQIAYLVIITISIHLISCSENTDQIRDQNNKDAQINAIDATEAKSESELANDFLLELKANDVDTILYSKRTCINCCDFYNIFWIKNGATKWNKFYFDFNDMKSHSVEKKMNDTLIFNTVFEYYSELKNTTIKENIHKRSGGTSTISVSDHYCFTQLKIYFNQDSLITNSMKDHSFDEYTGFDQSPNDKRETNDNYLENKHSIWNVLLHNIENVLINAEGISDREVETLRIKKGY
ncbi:hypothetical protein [Crocinitomix catalasitica]|uniref:hypothetical protein n=1 Tax=Crocinitomix catalasitica TaxID=184607 RepID=UPI000480E7CA|nr:hypothetical protein [Crocinitomix catalasitica]